MGKVINTRDVVFDEDTVFSGKSEDLMDNLMHSTWQEIATWVRSVELSSSLLYGEPETGSFHEDEAIQDEPTEGE